MVHLRAQGVMARSEASMVLDWEARGYELGGGMRGKKSLYLQN